MQTQPIPTEPDPIPLSEASERVRYQVHHLDMMSQFHDAFDIARRASVVLTPADVTPEFRSWLVGFFANCGMARTALKKHWRP